MNYDWLIYVLLFVCDVKSSVHDSGIVDLSVFTEAFIFPTRVPLLLPECDVISLQLLLRRIFMHLNVNIQIHSKSRLYFQM